MRLRLYKAGAWLWAELGNEPKFGECPQFFYAARKLKKSSNGPPFGSFS